MRDDMNLTSIMTLMVFLRVFSKFLTDFQRRVIITRLYRFFTFDDLNRILLNFGYSRKTVASKSLDQNKLIMTILYTRIVSKNLINNARIAKNKS